jgi:hypothetical protein
MSRFQLSGQLVKRLAADPTLQLRQPRTEADEKPLRTATSVFARLREYPPNLRSNPCI